MAHHLAALIAAAETVDEITVEQRIEIVDLILKVWSARRSFPGEVPAYELDLVFSALDMLGDDRPWRFSRLQHLAGNLSAANVAEVPMVVKAVSLERLTRQAILVLLWRAFEDAIARNESWLKTAEAARGSIADELASNTRRVGRHLLDLASDEPWDPDSPAAEDKVETTALTMALRVMSQQLAELADQLDRDSATGSA